MYKQQKVFILAILFVLFFIGELIFSNWIICCIFILIVDFCYYINGLKDRYHDRIINLHT